MDEDTQVLVDLLTPLVGDSPQLLDATTYASKSFYVSEAALQLVVQRFFSDGDPRCWSVWW